MSRIRETDTHMYTYVTWIYKNSIIHAEKKVTVSNSRGELFNKCWKTHRNTMLPLKKYF